MKYYIILLLLLIIITALATSRADKKRVRFSEKSHQRVFDDDGYTDLIIPT